MPPAAPRTLRLSSPEAAADLGARIARRLRPGEAVCLWGPLGAGKSTLARGLVRALTSPDEEAPSPTFTLVQAYQGPDFTLAHFDLYRLQGAAEAEELGLDEALDAGCAVIEWPERLEGALPPDRLDVALAVDPAAPEAGRLATLRGRGAWTEREHDLL